MDWNTLCRRDICERMLDIRMHPPKVIARCRNFAEQVTQFLPGVHLLLVCISCDGFLICPFLIPPNPMQPFLHNFVSDFFTRTIYETQHSVSEKIRWHFTPMKLIDIYFDHRKGVVFTNISPSINLCCLARTKSSKRPTWQWTWLSMDVRHQISQRSPSFLQSGILLLTRSLASSLSCSRFEPRQKNVS